MTFRALPPFAAAYLLFLAALAGACAGSFVNCAALRWPAGEKLPRGRSRCPACGHALGTADLIPVLSWVLLKGKCRYCGAPVSRRYPFTEALCALLWVSAAVRFGLTWETAEHCLLFSILLFLSLVDWDVMELPNGPMLAGAAAFLVFLPAHEAPLSRLAQGAVGALALGGGLLLISLIMDRLLGRETMGGGDIKLLAMLGLYTGPAAGLFLLLLACFIGLAFALRRGRGQAFPFGPALALAAWPAALWGRELAAWYLGLFL